MPCLRGSNLVVCCIFGGCISFSASRVGWWLSRPRMTPMDLGYRLVSDSSNPDEMYGHILERNKFELGRLLIAEDKEELKAFCRKWQGNPPSWQLENVIKYCTVPSNK
ncbi:hypothetical protein MHC_04445 [Mycoplasma haemocanis str. Illinois]|uniref:Uncharacterized protein n=1 Tax=Mycoplasma haemocanis (strain Illinois) TaxID=1111676 RepID=H6N7X3_MYCHN|nr:hypothetical protein [Mycoplasma haemocanis]AEW45745.2 hypothetical protein MHC_04445 [Mycoplasma haemocanis str. Illinois]